MYTLKLTSSLLIFLTGILLADDKPKWVDNRPVNPLYYIGIGYASKDVDADYRKIAKDNALRDLASEITINISSEFIHTIAEQSGMVEEDVKSYVRSTTEANLEGYRLMGTWENDGEYWAYYRLSKDDYEIRQKENLKKATGLSLDLYAKAKENEAQNKIADALVFYVQALNPIQDYMSEPLKVNYQGNQIYLLNNIYSSVQSLLSRLSLNVKKAKYNVKVGQSLKDPLKIEALYETNSGNKIAVKNLPVKYEFVRGNGNLIQYTQTDAAGNGSSTVSKITSTEKIQIIKAEVNIMSSLGEGASLIVQNIVKNFTLPSNKFIINVSGLSAYLEVSEIHFGKNGSMLYVEPKLKNALSDYGFTFTSDIAKADVVINLEARARKGAEVHGLFVAWVDMNISILDMASGQEIYKNSFPDIKGINLDYDKAAVKAFENAADKVSEILPGVIDKIQR